MRFCPKDKAGVQRPPGDWEEDAWYVVEMSFSANNPIHIGIMHCSFLDDKGKPDGYSFAVPANAAGDKSEISDVYYLKPLIKLLSEKDYEVFEYDEYPDGPEVIKPSTGWLPQTWYLVDVSLSEHNPIHCCLMYTGFLSNGEPGGYSCLHSANGGGNMYPISEAYYLKPRKRLFKN